MEPKLSGFINLYPICFNNHGGRNFQPQGLRVLHSIVWVSVPSAMTDGPTPVVNTRHGESWGGDVCQIRHLRQVYLIGSWEIWHLMLKMIFYVIIQNSSFVACCKTLSDEYYKPH